MTDDPVTTTTTVNAIAALNAALAAAQGEFPPIPRDKTVTVTTKTGGSYRFSYAPLDTILDKCRPVLSKHGLALTQRLEQNGDRRPAIRTELRHADGGCIAGSFPLPSMPESPQQLGSLITYLRRYAIVALLGVAAEEDDDGQQAADHEPARASDDARPDLATRAQVANIWRLLSKLEREGVATKDDLREQMGASNGTEDPAELTSAQASRVITDLMKLAGEEG